MSSLKGLDLSSCAVPRLVDLFSFVLRRFWGSVGCGVGVQDRPGRADRVSGRRSLTSTPSFGAGL